jgi:nucleoside phosphorylase
LCHIHAASPGGPRYDPKQSDAERNEAENLIILCPTHHSLVDQDSSTYTADALRTMKMQHEDRVRAILDTASVGIGDRQAVDFARQGADESVDFAIVVALPKELAAVRKFFPELVQVATVPSSSHSYYRGVVPTKHGGSYRVVVTMLHSMGNLQAAHATADLIRGWSPRFILVNGIAGGLSKGQQDFGDIVASESIIYYELAKVRSAGQERRNRQFLADPTLLDGILNLTGSAWKMRLPPRPDGTKASDVHPRIHIGPIASGEKIIAAVEAADDLRSTQANLIAVEMESAGVASAAFSATKKVGFLVIRAICDFADESKDDRWHEYAAQSAASCLREFIESRPAPLSEGSWPQSQAPLAGPRGQSSTALRKQLFEKLCDAFDVEEFKNLCFLLGVDIDELPGDRKSARVRELILLFERRHQLEVLEEAVQQNVPNERS